MKEIYRHHDHAKVGLLENLLKGEGIEVFLRNQNLTMSGLSEIPIPEFYPALCVMNEEDETKALELVEAFLTEENRPLGPDWSCNVCGEDVPDSMSECWSCQSPREKGEALA